MDGGGGGGGGRPRLALLTDAKKSNLGCLISFQLLIGFQNFINVLIKFTILLLLLLLLLLLVLLLLL